MCPAFAGMGRRASGGLPTTPPPKSLSNGTDTCRSAPDVAPNVVPARCRSSFGSWTPLEVQMTPVLCCTAGGPVVQHVTDCLAGLERLVSVKPATVAASAQIMTAHIMVRSAFRFNGLMLSLSGMAAQVTR